MPKTKISEFSSTPGSNTDIDGINIAEGCAPSGINDAIRELMAQLKDFQTGAAGDSFNGPVGTSTAAAGAFTTLSASGAVTLSGGAANGVAYLNGSKVLTTGSALTFDGTLLRSSTYLGLSTNTTPDTSTGDAIFYKASAGATLSGFNLVFETGSAGSRSEQMRLTSTGLGIGTSSPAAKLHIAGSTFRHNDATGSYGYTISAATNTTTLATLFGGSSFAIQTGASGTNQFLLDASGNLGIGVASPLTKLHLQDNSAVFIQLTDSGDGASRIGQNGTALTFGVDGANGATERARIDSSGNLLVGATSLNGAGKVEISYDRASHWGMQIRNTTGTTAATTYIAFKYVNTQTGYIESTGSTTSYITTSDYRLKENIAPMTGALAKVALLKPCTYTWKTGGAAGEGFIAHELQEVCPSAVSGVKDAVNEDGSIKPQGIDTSFLVATLTAAIQELKAEFDAYKATHP